MSLNFISRTVQLGHKFQAQGRYHKFHSATIARDIQVQQSIKVIQATFPSTLKLNRRRRRRRGFSQTKTPSSIDLSFQRSSPSDFHHEFPFRQAKNPCRYTIHPLIHLRSVSSNLLRFLLFERLDVPNFTIGCIFWLGRFGYV